MKISVILPSYKPGDYLWECLDSIYHQSFPSDEYETIIILNGCNEPYLSHIEGYLSNHVDRCSFRLIQTNVPGVSNARNIGIENSNGEYLTFVDDDDIISEKYLEELLNVSDRSSVGCCTSYSFEDNIQNIEENFLSVAYNRVKNTKYNIFKYRQFLSPPVCKLIHRDIIGNDRFPINLRRSEDSVFCLRISNKINELKLAAPSAVYYIRQRKGSATRNDVSIKDEFSELWKIEITYLKYWLSHPFSVNVTFMLSRIVAGFRNSYSRLKR